MMFALELSYTAHFYNFFGNYLYNISDRIPLMAASLLLQIYNE